LWLAGILAISSHAAVLNIGDISWDITFPGNSGTFDIANFTGADELAPDFPVATPVHLSSLSLLVHFSNGSATTFGSSYFTLAADGLSFDGNPIAIGGTNPKPISATLTGFFSPTTLNVTGSGTQTIDSSLSATILPSSGTTLADGDLALLVAGPPGVVVSGAPEPSSALLLIAGTLLLAAARWRTLLAGLRRMLSPVLLLLLGLTLSATDARAAVNLALWTAPDNGTAGVNTVNLTGSGFPSGTITPSNIVVTLAATCGGPALATTSATSITTVVLSTKRVGFLIPGTLAAGTYNVSISDSAGGDAAFTNATCSQVKVTHTNPTLSACIPTSSLGVLVPTSPGDVTAYVPKGYWLGSTTGIHVKNIEGTLGAGTSISTPAVVNSCSSNPATGQTVCVGNNTDVYLITGTSLNTTLTSGSTVFATFSGGSCQNCGVAINALTNKAVIAGGFSGGSSNQGVQLLDLNTNTFGAPFGMNNPVSENISVDPTRNLILTPGENFNYTILQIQPDGVTLQELSGPSTGLSNDSAAEDCSTGIAMTPGEFSNSVFLQDLTQATFGSSTYSAPNSTFNVVSSYSFSAGLSGLTVAPGSAHLALATGEFGGNSFAVLQLPAGSGSGTPTVSDYATAQIPSSAACGGFFGAGFDPHTVTAYTSPNDGKAYGVFVGYAGQAPVCLAKVDLAAVLAASRGGAGLSPHDVAAANLPAGAITFFTLP
jgi:hypothetical protein